MPSRLTAPPFGSVAVTARRWLDIASPGPGHTGADDYFSSDLPHERLLKTFGRVPPSAALIILFSGNDEFVPPSINKHDLVHRWITAVRDGGGNVDILNGSIVPEATHNLNGCPEPVVQDLVHRVVGFLGRLDSSDFSSATDSGLEDLTFVPKGMGQA